MSFNFPNVPIEGQIVTFTGGISYIYQSGVWNRYVAGSGVTADMRNRIVNGAMQISQENGNTGGTTDEYYAADQWSYSFVNISGVTAARLPTPGSSGPPYRLRLTSTTADTTIAASDNITITQRVEGIRITDFKWGQPDAKPAVLRFTTYSSVAGTYSVVVRNVPTTYSWIGTFTIAAGEINTFVDRTFAIPVPPGGTWATDNTVGLLVTFVLVAGPSIIGVPGWQAGSLIGAPGHVNWLGTANSTFIITNVGLHLDPFATGIAPPWQTPDEAAELLACQRYWYRCSPSASAGHRWAGVAGDSFMSATEITFPVTMRAPPTGVASTAPTYTNCSTISFFTDVAGCSMRVTATAIGKYRALAGVYDFNARM